MTLRNRDLSQSSPNATRPVRLPALSAPRTGDRGMDAWIDAINKRLDIREGAGSAFDQFVTKRDLVRFGVVTQEQVTNPSTVPAPVAPGVVISTGSGTTSISMEQFATSIKQTRLYVDLTRKIDDPSRFDDLTKRTRDALLAELAPINGQITADIRRVEEKFSNANESFAQTVDTLTAGVASAASGVREVRFASASANLATAGVVTQVQARLDNFSGGAPGTATVESKMTAIANRATGLEAQYTLKVTAGGAMAGFGLAATTNASGNATSAFIIQADKFAIVDSSYAGGLTNTPSAANVMFGVDSVTGTFLNGDILCEGIARFHGGYSDPIAGGIASVVVNDQPIASKSKFGIISYGNSSSGSTALNLYNSGTGNGMQIVSESGSGITISTGINYSTSALTPGTGIQISCHNSADVGIRVLSGVGSTAISMGACPISWNSIAIAAPTGSTSTYLRNDGTWAAPAGTGVTSVTASSSTGGLTLSSSGGTTPAISLSGTPTSSTQISAGGHTYTFSGGSVTGTGVATFSSTNKPGASTANIWLAFVIDGTTYDLPAWPRV
jgi:hypothetical protein